MKSEHEQRIKQLVRRTVGEPYVGKRLKLRQIARSMPQLPSGSPQCRILDFGTEDATFVYWLADRYQDASVTAIDLDAEAMLICRSLTPSSYRGRVDFQSPPLEDLADNSFDLITAFDVLEHIVDDRSALQHLTRVLRPGGYLLVHVPRDQWTRVDGRVERVPDEDAWQINPGHVRMGYSPERLTELVQSVGLDVLSTDLWLRRWGVRAHAVYNRMEQPSALRLLTIPFTDAAAVLDRRRPPAEGNTVWLEARKPGRITPG